MEDKVWVGIGGVITLYGPIRNALPKQDSRPEKNDPALLPLPGYPVKPSLRHTMPTLVRISRKGGG